MSINYQMVIAQAIVNDFEPGSEAWKKRRSEADRVIEALRVRGVDLIAASAPARQDEELVERVFSLISPLTAFPARDMDGVVLRNEIRAKARAIIKILEGE